MAHDASPTGAVPADHDPIASGADDTFGIDPGIYARRWQIHSVLCVSLVAIVAAVSSLNVAIPTIIEALEPSPTQTLWIVDSYALVFAPEPSATASDARRRCRSASSSSEPWRSWPPSPTPPMH